MIKFERFEPAGNNSPDNPGEMYPQKDSTKPGIDSGVDENTPAHSQKESNPNRRKVIGGMIAMFLSSLSPEPAQAKKRQAPRAPKPSFEKIEPTPSMKEAVESYMQELKKIPLPEAHTAPQGMPVNVEDLYIDLPIPNPEQIFPPNIRAGAIVVPEFHKIFLFKKENDQWQTIVLPDNGVAGTAKTAEGYSTPRGYFKVYRKEGKGYSSRSYPPSDGGEPNMEYAVFFERSGVALHKSTNFFTNPKTGKRQLKIDNSHGCVNLDTQDAIKVHKALSLGDVVLVLDDAHKPKRMSYKQYMQSRRVKVPRDKNFASQQTETIQTVPNPEPETIKPADTIPDNPETIE